MGVEGSPGGREGEKESQVEFECEEVDASRASTHSRRGGLRRSLSRRSRDLKGKISTRKSVAVSSFALR